jgi:steroid delta-isomerase
VKVSQKTRLFRPNRKVQKNRIQQSRHNAMLERNVERLMVLYAEESVLESSAILVVEKEKLGILRGKTKIRLHLDALFRMLGESICTWRCSDPLYSNDRERIIWEYPSQWPEGCQLDVGHFADIKDGLIVHHRMYWGWRGFHALVEEAFRL